MVRQRHPPIALKRDTHTLSPVDYATPADRLYSSEMDIEAVTVVDLGKGSVTEGAIVPGGLDGTIAIKPGTLPPPTLDTSPPPVPYLKAVASQTVQQLDGTPITNLVATVGYTVPPVGLVDLDQIIIQTTRFGTAADPTLPDWTLATQWASQSADATGTLDTLVVQPTVLAATKYWVRAFAVDMLGNRQPTPSNIVSVITDRDTEGPPQPAGVILAPGNSNFGVRWDPNTASDLAYVEVQWRATGSGAPWLGVQVNGTLVVVSGVVNGTAYDVRLRSVDQSGNALNDTGTLDSEGKPIFATVLVADPANDDKGFVTAGPVTPVAIGATSLVWTDAMIQTLFSGKLRADWLTAGSITVGGGVGQVAAIKVVDAEGHTIGTWDENGIALLDPARVGPPAYAGNPNYKATFDESGLFIWDMTNPALPIAVVSITPAGIDANSITFGKQRGGHNLVENSSFELGAFSAVVKTTLTEDSSTEWSVSRQGTDTNLATAASITMLAV